MSKGYKMIDGKAFLLNGTCSGYTPEDTQIKLAVEKSRKKAEGLIVRVIKRSSISFALYTFPIDERNKKCNP